MRRTVEVFDRKNKSKITTLGIEVPAALHRAGLYGEQGR